MGQSPDGSTYSDEPSDYILVQGNADLQNGWVCPRIWTTQITKKADAGDLIMSVRAPAGAMGKTAYNAVIGRGVAAIKGNEFIYQLLVKMDADGFWKTLSCGSTFESLNSDNIKNAEVKIPTTAEQIKIGDYFQQLDNLITLHQREFVFLCKEKIEIIRYIKNTWEQRKLGEIGSVSMCRRIFKEQTSENGEIPFYKIGTFGGEADAFISRELFEEYKAKYQYPKKGDILISASGSIGRTVVFTGKNEYFQDSNIVWLNHDKHLDNSFLKCFYSIVKWAGIEGSTIKRLYNDNILNTAITLPSVEEQQKIGAYFENLDNLITLHQRKCQIDGCRFQSPLAITWEQRKLSEIATMHARIGWQNLRTSEFLDNGDYMLITGTDFMDGAVNFDTCHYVERERYEQDKHIQIRNGSILITKDGTLGKVAYIQGLTMPATLNAGVFNVEIRDEKEVDNRYLFQYLKAPFLMDYVDKKATGGTIKHLNQNILVDFPVVLPQKDEQAKIGEYFLGIDNLITLHQCE